MIPLFDGLNTDEQSSMLDAIPLVTILIAGADGDIDHQELEWAEKVTKIRSYSYHESLRDFYLKVGETYGERLNQMLSDFPKETSARTEAISALLAKLNDILAKLDPNLARRYHKSLLSFAKHVAKASGGFLGMGSISREEEALLGLEMIHPIELDEEEATAEEEDL